MLRLTILTAALAVGGCEGLLADGLDAGAPRYDAELPPADVAGRWVITGSGSLTACDDPRYDTPNLRIESAPFSVRQSGTALTADAPPQPPGGTFELREGSVNADTVHFKTIEQSPEAAVALTYDGRIDDLGRVVGRFTGIGPGTCEGRGTFVVEIE
jgi:hypothetical protein